MFFFSSPVHAHKVCFRHRSQCFPPNSFHFPLSRFSHFLPSPCILLFLSWRHALRWTCRERKRREERREVAGRILALLITLRLSLWNGTENGEEKKRKEKCLFFSSRTTSFRPFPLLSSYISLSILEKVNVLWLKYFSVHHESVLFRLCPIRCSVRDLQQNWGPGSPHCRRASQHVSLWVSIGTR